MRYWSHLQPPFLEMTMSEKTATSPKTQENEIQVEKPATKEEARKQILRISSSLRAGGGEIDPRGGTDV